MFVDTPTYFKNEIKGKGLLEEKYGNFPGDWRKSFVENSKIECINSTKQRTKRPFFLKKNLLDCASSFTVSLYNPKYGL